MKNFDEEARLCTTCAFMVYWKCCIMKSNLSITKCDHPLVVNKADGRPISCNIERQSFSGECGNEGKFWEPK